MPGREVSPSISANVGSPEAFLAGDDFQRLRQLVAPGNLADRLPRAIQLPDDDPFGLLEVQDTYERLLAQGFRQAVNLVDYVVPRLGRRVRRAWEKGRRIELPEQKLGDLYAFRMAAQKDSKAATGRYISFYRSDDSSVTNRGFTIHRQSDGHIILRDEARGSVDPSDSKLYGDMVEKALRWIHDYAIQLGHQPDYLAQPLYRPTRRERAGAFIGSKVRASAAFVTSIRPHTRRSHITHLLTMSNETKNKKQPPVSKTRVVGRMLLIGSCVPMPLVGPGIAEEGPLSLISRPAAIMFADGFFGVGDNIFNGSENKREAFDKKGLHLSDTYPVATVGGDPVPIAHDGHLPKEVYGAPNAQTMTTLQDVIGGIRNLDNGGANSIVAKQCGFVTINVKPDAQARAVTDNTALKGKLTIRLTERKIEICNTTDQNYPSGIEDIWIEVTEPPHN